MKQKIIFGIMICCLSVMVLGASDISEFLYEGNTLIGYRFDDGRETTWEYDESDRLSKLHPLVGGIEHEIAYAYFESGTKKDKINEIKLKRLGSNRPDQKVRYDYDDAGRTILIAEAIGAGRERVKGIEYVPDGEHKEKVKKTTLTQPKKNGGQVVIEDSFDYIGGTDDNHMVKTTTVNNKKVGSVSYKRTEDATIIETPTFKKTTKLVLGNLKITYESDTVNGDCSYSLSTGGGSCTITSLDGDDIMRKQEVRFTGEKVSSEKVSFSHNNQVAYEQDVSYSSEGEVESFTETHDGETRSIDYRYEEGKLMETDDFRIDYGDDELTGDGGITLKAKADDMEFDVLSLPLGGDITQGVDIVDGTITDAVKGIIDGGVLDGEDYELEAGEPEFTIDLTGQVLYISFPDGESEEYFYGFDRNLIYYIDKKGKEHYYLEGREVKDSEDDSSFFFNLFFVNIFKLWIKNVRTLEDVYTYLDNTGAS